MRRKICDLRPTGPGLASVCVLLSFACVEALPDQEHQGALKSAAIDKHEAEERCSEVAPLALEAAWLEVGEAKGEALLARPILEFKQVNVGDRTIEIAWTGILDTADMRTKSFEIDRIVLRPGEQSIAKVDLTPFENELLELSFSGSLKIYAEIRDTKRGARLENYELETLYLHPVSDGFLAYGSEILRSKYYSGDYRGVVEPSFFKSTDTVVSRIIYGGAGLVEPRIELNKEKKP